MIKSGAANLVRTAIVDRLNHTCFDNRSQPVGNEYTGSLLVEQCRINIPHQVDLSLAVQRRSLPDIISHKFKEDL
jgi:hypothetical protein